MTDLDALRAALHGTQQNEPGSVDIDRIMTIGRRIRRRRRLTAGGAALGVTAALLFGASSLNQVRPHRDTAQPQLVISAGQAADPAASPLGQVLATGIQDQQGEQVLYFTATAGDPVNPTGPPPAELGITEGHRTATGAIVPGVTGIGTAGNEGFHALTQLLVHNGHDTLLFGYYTGPARRITVDVNGKEVQAHQSAWSRDPAIIGFWFDPSSVPITAAIAGVHAYN